MTRRVVSAFIDTHALLALINADDAHHDAATLLVQQLADSKSNPITSEWVLAEFLNFASSRRFRTLATETIQRLERSQRTTIIPASHGSWIAALTLYKEMRDKSWSLIDCSSIAICRERRIRHVLTHDHHFTQAGLTVLID